MDEYFMDWPMKDVDNTNPKDLLGMKKVSLTKFPATALIHGAKAMMCGADKYGSYNWREKEVVASIYIDAAMRHLLTWFEGQELATDSGVHHLGHAMACMGILLDAQETGNLKDDRPVSGNRNLVDELLEKLREKDTVKNIAPKCDVCDGRGFFDEGPGKYEDCITCKGQGRIY